MNLYIKKLLLFEGDTLEKRLMAEQQRNLKSSIQMLKSFYSIIGKPNTLLRQGSYGNWNILVPCKKIKRDASSSGERTWFWLYVKN